MTCEEFSNAFDVLLTSYKHKTSFGDQSSLADLVLDEYEKSIFLTQAQDRIVKAYFEKTLNPEGLGFDSSSKRQMDFSNLITTIELTASNASGIKYAENSILLNWNKNDFKPLLFLNEKVILQDDKVRVVVPINYTEYDRQLSKAYSEPNKKQAWRLFSGKKNENDNIPIIEIVLNSNDVDSFKKYKVRFVKRPKPIVLIDLYNTSNNLSISGVNAKTECELDPIIHHEILQEAVKLALQYNNIETPEAKVIKEANK